MIRLGQKGANNVLIFSMIILIVLFSRMDRLFGPDQESIQGIVPLLPQDSPLITLDFGQHQIQRIGKGWRIKPGLSDSEQDIADIAHRWQTTEMILYSQVTLTEPYVVVAWLAGEDKGRVFKLMSFGTDLLVEYQQQVYLIAEQPLSSFIPQELH
ncbi:hypothetical protein EYS14_17145 [Alteromonadaceae bacterium M269]|nr:hypothetical protein EYS14_17145 [Alteromonadaceae bacterium M269]